MTRRDGGAKVAIGFQETVDFGEVGEEGSGIALAAEMLEDFVGVDFVVGAVLQCALLIEWDVFSGVEPIRMFGIAPREFVEVPHEVGVDVGVVIQRREVVPTALLASAGLNPLVARAATAEEEFAVGHGDGAIANVGSQKTSPMKSALRYWKYPLPRS